jgi:hypothetical protein
MSRWTRWPLVMGVVLGVAAPGAVGAVPTLRFDDPLVSGGLIAYHADGGPASGSSILFQSIEGIETPMNPGVVLSCIACMVSFRTGSGSRQGDGAWEFGGGGMLAMTGSIPEIGIDRSATLASGSLTSIRLEWNAGQDLGVFSGLGGDVKHPRLAAFYGLDPESFAFAISAVAVGPVVDRGGAISGFVLNADFMNSISPVGPAELVPSPAALLLLAAGWLGGALARLLLSLAGHRLGMARGDSALSRCSVSRPQV